VKNVTVITCIIGLGPEVLGLKITLNQTQSPYVAMYGLYNSLTVLQLLDVNNIELKS